jgi:hypothetical protein
MGHEFSVAAAQRPPDTPSNGLNQLTTKEKQNGMDWSAKAFSARERQ